MFGLTKVCSDWQNLEGCQSECLTQPKKFQELCYQQWHITTVNNGNIVTVDNGHNTTVNNGHITAVNNGHNTTVNSKHNTAVNNGHITTVNNGHIYLLIYFSSLISTVHIYNNIEIEDKWLVFSATFGNISAILWRRKIHEGASIKQ
jgi:hypothetical protein